MADRIPRSAIAGRRGHWLLDLNLGGRVFRFAGEPLVVTDATGHTYAYALGLDAVEVTYTLDEGGSPKSVAVTIGPTCGVDWASLEGEGVDVSTGKATLRRWFEGQVLEAARTVLVGRANAPEYGDRDEPITLSIEAFPWVQTAMVPDADAVVCDDTFVRGTTLTADEQFVGCVYPTIIGNPGKIATAGVSDSVPCAPAYLVEYGKNSSTVNQSKLLIAGHEVAATNVNVWDLSSDGKAGTGVATRPVQKATDLRGRTVSYIDFNGSAQQPVLGHEYRTSWPFSGGVLRRDRSGPIRGAGEVIDWLMQQSGIALNLGAAQAQRAFLDAYLIDTYIAERVKPYDWIQSNLAPILPISWVETGAGGYWAAWRTNARVTEAIARLDADADPTIQRVTPITRAWRAGLANRFKLKYAYDERNGSYAKTALLGVTTSKDRSEAESWACKVSQSRYDVVEVSLETRAVYDEATALLSLRNMARERCFSRREVTYQCPPEMEHLLPGDIVTLTDSAVYLSNAVAQVTDVAVAEQGPAVSLRIQDDPDIIAKRTV